MLDWFKSVIHLSTGVDLEGRCDDATFIGICNDVIANKEGSINHLIGALDRIEHPSEDVMRSAEEVLRFSVTDACKDNHLKTVMKPWVQERIGKYNIESITD